MLTNPLNGGTPEIAAAAPGRTWLAARYTYSGRNRERIARLLAYLDVTAALAEVALQNNYVRPNLSDDDRSRLSAAFPEFSFSFPDPGRIRVEAMQPIGVGPLVRVLEDRGIDVSEARRMRPSLEEVFVSVTGIEADAMRNEKEKKGKGA